MSEIAKREAKRATKRKGLSEILEGVRRGVEKTEVDADGVNLDALDTAEIPIIKETASKVAEALKKARRPPPLPAIIPKIKPPTKLMKGLPAIQAAALAYETASLINSEEARRKAREQAEEMEKRGYSAEGIAKNAAQGFFDPAGTIYAAGDALLDPNTWRGFGEFLKSGSRSPRERNRRRGRR